MNTRNIVGVSLRASVVFSVMSFLYFSYVDFTKVQQSIRSSDEIQNALICGSKIDINILESHKGEGDVIDISRFGCGNKSPFFARIDEINDAKSGIIMITVRRNVDIADSLGRAFIVFILINLIGVLLVSIKMIGTWILFGRPFQ